VGFRVVFNAVRILFALKKSGRKAQVSAELLIVIAAVIAIALVLITQLQHTAEHGKKVLNNATDKAFDAIADIK